ncbi:hypothetical protein BS628_01450 [Agrobacterium radiobacter]|nr:hypothetical protein FHL81_10730 [Agrobacterium tumefaciens]OOO38715.1 hypothetical protein BS628_01450 [Agrobacterium radiobacter]TGE80264.1 hypothetical protein C9410_08390 [Rhizobium sp. SEMIA 439]KAB0462154.1 hypothetical protein F7R04_00655 [Agrobacterium tumefaciens]MQB28232.1 hypothetical protein [Agrobacterium tumefaciens]
MLASSTPKLSAVHPPIDSMEFVSADYNVCVTVTCHDRTGREIERRMRGVTTAALKRKALRIEGPNRHDGR